MIQKRNTNTQALIIRQNEKIAGLEEGICSILEYNMCLEKNKDHAEE
ncbi:2640_t:CDS:2, partial [Rhizophagus irregularis]